MMDLLVSKVCIGQPYSHQWYGQQTVNPVALLLFSLHLAGDGIANSFVLSPHCLPLPSDVSLFPILLGKEGVLNRSSMLEL